MEKILDFHQIKRDNENMNLNKRGVKDMHDVINLCDYREKNDIFSGYKNDRRREIKLSRNKEIIKTVLFLVASVIYILALQVLV